MPIGEFVSMTNDKSSLSRANIFNDISKSEASYEDVRATKKHHFYCFISDYNHSVEHKETITSHYHDYIELIYVIQSSVEVTVNKKQFTARSGDLLVAIPGDVHSLTRKKGTVYVCIQAEPNFLFGGVLSNSDLHFIIPYTLYCHPEARLFKASEIDNTDIPKLIQTIVQENSDKRNFYMLSIRAALSSIALSLFRSWDSLSANLSSEVDISRQRGLSKLAPTLEQIDRKYMTNLTAAQMAKDANMSYSYFSRFFKLHTGQTFSEYLNSVRIREAETLLLNDKVAIADIALMVGFTNTSYFISQFKRYLHITPKKYRKKFSPDKK